MRGDSVTKGNRDDRGRQARPDAGASGKGKLGSGYRGEKELSRPKRYNDGAQREQQSFDSGEDPAWRKGGGLAIDKSMSRSGMDKYEPRHTSKTR